MDATTATSKAETAFHIGDVAPDENAGRLADSEWWVEDNDYFNAAARRPFISFMLHCICLLLADFVAEVRDDGSSRLARAS